MSERNFKTSTPTEKFEELFALAHEGGDFALASLTGGLKAYNKAYEETRNPAMLENIIMELLAYITEAKRSLLLPQNGGAFTNSSSFLAINRETGELCGNNCFAPMGGRGSLSIDEKISNTRTCLPDLVEAFKDHFTKAGEKATSTIQIYANCIFKELFDLLPDYFNIDEADAAITVAIEQIKNSNTDPTKRLKKNERAALGRLKKVLKDLFEKITDKYQKEKRTCWM